MGAGHRPREGGGTGGHKRVRPLDLQCSHSSSPTSAGILSVASLDGVHDGSECGVLSCVLKTESSAASSLLTTHPIDIPHTSHETAALGRHAVLAVIIRVLPRVSVGHLHEVDLVDVARHPLRWFCSEVLHILLCRPPPPLIHVSTYNGVLKYGATRSSHKSLFHSLLSYLIICRAPKLSKVITMLLISFR